MKRMLLTVLLVSLCAMGSTAAKKVYRRQIVKEFSVGARPELALSNRFGEIRIVEGADRKITVRVELRGEGKTEEEARRYAEAVNVDLSLSGNRVEGRTTFQKIICNNCGRAADFTVTAPRDVVLSLANQFGNIYINRATQPLTVTVKYGDLYLKEASTASVNVSFGKASIDRCATLNLNSQYSGITLGTVGRLTGQTKFDGTYRIESVGRCTLTAGYTQIRIDRLSESCVVDKLRFSGLRIGEVARGFSEISVKASYSEVHLGLTPGHAFRADLSASYGQIHTGDLNIRAADTRSGHTNQLSGTAGASDSPRARVSVTSSFGDIYLK